VKTPASYWAMFTGIASKEQADRMVAYLRDPQAFGTAWPVPTVAADEQAYAPGSYANGSVLINVNWLTLLGLERYHYRDLADWLARKTLDLVARESSPREYYHPETGEGSQAESFNWSGALFVRIVHDRTARPRPAS
jgi:putative isomerase